MSTQNKSKKFIKYFIIIAVALVAINLMAILNKEHNSEQISATNYTQFLQEVKDGKINSVTLLERARGPRELSVSPKEGKEYTFILPNDPMLIDQLVKNNVKLTTKIEPEPSGFSVFLNSWGPTIFFLVVWIWFMKKMSGGAGGGKGLFSFSKSKAQLIDPDKINTKFSDVVGCDEAKHEITEFVDFLKNPDKFVKLGGRIPRGVLLTGPAGTGKTLLAKALAKESGVPFFSMSGSDFVEMFVGVGAGRVRDMFEQAKKVAPCVLFIDEIDTIGAKRGGGSFGGGGVDEREQTLNQILVEMDGMDTHKGVILVGATNRPEVLDPALLRPGRIDRQIVVSLPDVNGREEILKIHSKNVPLSTNVNMRKIARGTPGFSGAELANLINESTIFAARRNSKFVEQIDLDKAKDKIMMGVERPSLAMSDEDKKDTAYHESGHAIVAKLIKDADPVHKVTIIPRGRALGLTLQLPEKDRWSHKKQYLLDRIAILMGGRLAEELFCNTMTNGASNDISVATNTARSMVMEWGMSSLGPIAYGDRQSGFLGNGQMNSSMISQDTHMLVDAEVRNIINEQYNRAKKLLEENSDKVEAMTQALMEIETLDDWHIDNIMNGVHYAVEPPKEEENTTVNEPNNQPVETEEEVVDKIDDSSLGIA